MTIPFRSACLSFILACLLLVACSKKESGPSVPPMADTPVVHQDTLTAGWSEVKLPGEALSDIFFYDSSHGYLVGNALYRSADGGNTWSTISYAQGFHDLFVTADGRGFFVNFFTGLMQNTAVNPAIVKGIANEENPNTPTDIYFVDNTHGFYIVYDGLYRTSDGGVTWTKTASPQISAPRAFSSLYFADTATGWCFSGSRLYKSDGKSVSYPAAFAGNYDFSCVRSVSKSVVFLADQTGQLFKSIDGGTTFKVITRFPGGSGFQDLHFLSEDVGYACFGKYIFNTTDGGASWAKSVALLDRHFTEIHFTDTNHGWAVADSSVFIYKR